MKSSVGQFYILRGQKNYEVYLRGDPITLPEGSGGETPPGPAIVEFGETNHSRWPDAFQTVGITAFRDDIINGLMKCHITGVEWHPVIVAKIRNRRLNKVPPPHYLWPRITGRIRTTPYYSKYVDTQELDPEGNPIQKKIRTDHPVELDPQGCMVINVPDGLYLSHEIQSETWDGSDLMRVLPIVAPYEVCSKKLADRLIELKVENIKAFPLTKGYGI